MKQNKSLVITAVLLVLSIGNYYRISGNENIRTIQFLSIFVIGMLAGVLLRGIIATAKSKNS
jgi:hypothetical protein